MGALYFLVFCYDSVIHNFQVVVLVQRVDGFTFFFSNQFGLRFFVLFDCFCLNGE